MKAQPWLYLGALLAAPAWAGVRFETKTGAEQSTFTLQGDRFRVDQRGPDGGRVVLVDNGKHTLTLLNAKEKSFNTLQMEQLEALGSQADQRMEEALSQLPPEQRKQVEASAKGSPAKAEEVKFEALHKKDKVAGKTCDWYRGLRGGKPFVEGCYIAWSAVGLSAPEVTPVFKTVEALRALRARLGRGGEAAPDSEKGPGFPGLRVPVSPKGEKGTEERLVSLERLTVPPAELEIPPGYHESTSAPTP